MWNSSDNESVLQDYGTFTDSMAWNDTFLYDNLEQADVNDTGSINWSTSSSMECEHSVSDSSTGSEADILLSDVNISSPRVTDTHINRLDSLTTNSLGLTPLDKVSEICFGAVGKISGKKTN